ncbi:nicotinamidase [Dichotomicrobium thermohalophilum]|uniref:nicotinamidase n=1 Tax=Dichotomicrobium thermohalophilum TaxID=933063 RepID=A0A397PDH4_9HYPH|nr:nicotinamidase [Dichotomicrobium thermohalophilum]RIA47546.1 nicotinamidase/pyrazinamidase [Dichotomicrobium thermohalophilum]
MIDPRETLREGDALLVIDVQNDFCPGGALEIPEGHKIIPPLNKWIAAARELGVPIYASRDWHPERHPSFEPHGGPWPPHCVQDTEGAAFHDEVDVGDAIVVTKGTRFDKDQYSAFDETGLAEELRRRGIKRVWIGGLAQDVCVKATAIDAAKAGFETHVLPEATLPVTPEGGAEAVAEMRKAGVTIES